MARWRVKWWGYVRKGTQGDTPAAVRNTGNVEAHGDSVGTKINPSTTMRSPRWDLW
jgi:hypothetical protein